MKLYLAVGFVIAIIFSVAWITQERKQKRNPYTPGFYFSVIIVFFLYWLLLIHSLVNTIKAYYKKKGNKNA